MNDEPVSPLRRRMIEDMKIRGFSEKTRSDYVRHVKAFARFLGRSPHRAGPKELRRCHLHLAASGVGSPSINSAVSALRFFFKVTLGRDPARPHRPNFPRKRRRSPGCAPMSDPHIAPPLAVRQVPRPVADHTDPGWPAAPSKSP